MGIYVIDYIFCGFKATMADNIDKSDVYTWHISHNIKIFVWETTFKCYLVATTINMWFNYKSNVSIKLFVVET